MMKLKNGETVNAEEARKVLAALREVRREHPTAFSLLVEKSKELRYRFPQGEKESLVSVLRERELVDQLRSIPALVASVVASSLREEEGKVIIGSPFDYEGI